MTGLEEMSLDVVKRLGHYVQYARSLPCHCQSRFRIHDEASCHSPKTPAIRNLALLLLV